MTYENKNFKVEINNGKVVITKKNFNDKYFARIDENGRIHACSSLGLKYAMNLRNEFGF